MLLQFSCYIKFSIGVYFQVKFTVFKVYAKAVGYFYVLFIFLNMILFQALNVYSNFWLTFWTEDPLLKNTTLGHTNDYEKQYEWYLIWYTVIGVIQGKS